MSKAYALGADFTGADFKNAVVDRVTFDNANLTNANFFNAVITGGARRRRHGRSHFASFPSGS